MSEMNWHRKEAPCGSVYLPANEMLSALGFIGDQNTVKVLVGKDLTTYTLPCELLCRHSEVFSAHIQSNSDQGAAQIIRLGHVSSKTFKYAVQWMLFGDIKLDAQRFDIGIKHSLGEEYEYNKALEEEKKLSRRNELKVYLDFLLLAGDLLLFPHPTDKIMEKMLRIMKEYPQEIMFDGPMIRQAWSLPSAHPVRELFIKGSIIHYLFSQYKGIRQDANEDQECGMDAEYSEYSAYSGCTEVRRDTEDGMESEDSVYLDYSSETDYNPDPQTMFERTGELATLPASELKGGSFEFYHELDTVPGFAADFLRFASLSMAMEALPASPDDKNKFPRALRHPLTGKFMSMQKWGVEFVVNHPEFNHSEFSEEVQEHRFEESPTSSWG